MKTRYAKGIRWILCLLFCGIVAGTATTVFAQDRVYAASQVKELTKFLTSSIPLSEEKSTTNAQILGVDGEKPEDWSFVRWNDAGEAVALDLAGKELQGKLDLSTFSTLESLNIAGNHLIELQLKDHPALTQLNCSGNELTMLDLSGCDRLESLDCSDNFIQSLHLKTAPKTKYDCKGNLLHFAALQALPQSDKLIYAPQKPIFMIAHSEVDTIYAGELVDLAGYGAQDTQWYEENGTPLTPDHPQEQQYMFGASMQGKKIYAVMTNKSFPELQLKTENILITSKPIGLLALFLIGIISVSCLIFLIRYALARRKGVPLIPKKKK